MNSTEIKNPPARPFLEKMDAPPFREALRGYNHEDVHNYIIDLNRRCSESEAECESRLRRAQEELSDLKIRLDATEKSCSDLRSALDKAVSAKESAEKLVANFNENLTSANEELQSMREKIVVLTSRLDEETQRADEAVESVENAKSEAYQKARVELEASVSDAVSDPVDSEKDNKAALYDNMSRQLGNILLDARANAEGIVARAKERADRMAADAAALLAAAEQKAQQRVIDAEEDAARTRTAAASEAEALRGETEAQMARAKERFNDTLTQLNKQTGSEYRLLLQTAQRNLSATVTDITSQLDSICKRLTEESRSSLVTDVNADDGDKQ